MFPEPVAPNAGLSAARRVRERLAGPTFTAQIARLYSLRTKVRAGLPRFSNWNDAEAAERLREAFQLVDAALVERSGGSDVWQGGLRRAAEILEWLAEADADADSRIPLLSAAAYQIAGYPARSRSLVENSGDSSVLRHFLAADFPALYGVLPSLWHKIIDEAEEGDPPLETALLTETLRALGIISASMRWGDEGRLTAAIDKLKDASALMLHGGDTVEWLFAKLCGVTGEIYARSALRSQVGLLAETLTATGRSVLERYARQAYIERHSLVWPSQMAGIRAVLSSRNFALCTPTGSGKTSVAELAILQSLFDRTTETLLEGPIALYLVPSRALATEVERRLSRTVTHLAADSRITVTGLYGGTDWGPTDAWLTNLGPVVLICTYEKAEALLRFIGPLFVRRVRLVVVDEAHSVNFTGGRAAASSEGNRQLRLESLMMRLLARLDNGQIRFAALSAVAQGSEEAISSWIAGSEEAVPIKVAYRSLRQLVGRLLCGPAGYRIEYDLLDGSELRLASRSGHEDRPYV